jgi:hypothetical protein
MLPSVVRITLVIVARWPKFRPKGSKKPGKNKIGRICGRILPKVTEKGLENIFYRRSLFHSTDTLSETKKNFNLISN